MTTRKQAVIYGRISHGVDTELFYSYEHEDSQKSRS